MWQNQVQSMTSHNSNITSNYPEYFYAAKKQKLYKTLYIALEIIFSINLSISIIHILTHIKWFLYISLNLFKSHNSKFNSQTLLSKYNHYYESHTTFFVFKEVVMSSKSKQVIWISTHITIFGHCYM